MTQANARLPHLGTYRRELPVSLARLYENAIDWEHLPYLHRTTFARIEPINAGEWGFRARVWTHPYEEQRSFVIELKLDRDCQRWITSTIEGSGTGTEIWTHAFSLAEYTTLVVVDFFVPGVSQDGVARLADYYRRLYAQLYDEDVTMMTTRERELARVRDGCSSKTPTTMVLGPTAEVLQRLPLDIEFGGARFRVVEHRGELVAYSTLCPHAFGPLGEGRIEDGVVECPWHGYRFDLWSGKCVSGGQCRLKVAPEVQISATGQVMLTADRDF